MLCKETMRHKIVEAARKRFLHYGYGKTTMAEVARDCNMSPGNLYRYFPGKLDIAEEIGDEVVEETLAALRDVVHRPGLTATERLCAFFDVLLERTYQTLEEDPKVFEIAQILAHERPAFANRQLARQRSLLTEILSDGNRSGEFTVGDVVLTAEMLQAATMKFKFPQLWSKLQLPELKRELNGVLDLLLTGLEAREETADDRRRAGAEAVNAG
jgi:AcrR family transcriptional regulator